MIRLDLSAPLDPSTINLGQNVQLISNPNGTFGDGNEQIVLTPKEAAGIVVATPYYQELSTPSNKRFVAAWHRRYGPAYSYITDPANDVWIARRGDREVLVPVVSEVVLAVDLDARAVTVADWILDVEDA